MFQSVREWWERGYAPLRERFGQRFAGLVLALLVELLIALVLLTLGGPTLFKKDDGQASLSVFSVPDSSEDSEQADEAASAPAAPAQPVQKTETAEAQPTDAVPPPPDRPKPPPLPVKNSTQPWIELSKNDMAASDIEAKPSASPPKAVATKKVYGPVAPPGTGVGSDDTPQVGTAPNGEPLYAARWYREPYPDELRGFLSSARGPGWGLIACKTAPDYRVEDCQIIDEYPQGSGIARAAQAAAFQFKVRPPRVGGKSQIGAWVRIRIDYGIKLSN
ncbi:hypothetical protein [Stakelama pacifica]|uniref:Protein TonB n=1 Tax=Stakelama pacifica TaxID=517720 RepID=A0A4R6FH31_9SPHN|nr:hypothetical protein [Stakelama pacifica]TDN80642.1 protein TonB [Stakelama pacifica]GGO97562.1 hypothetical protein GCM10011329_26730 [Stakelama pacifica]